MIQVDVHQKETQHCKSSTFHYKNKVKVHKQREWERNCYYLFRGGEATWCHSIWSQRRHGSQGWTVMGLRELVRMGQQMQPHWSYTAWSSLHGSKLSSCRGANLQLKHAWDTQRMVDPVGGKRFEKSPHLLISWCLGSPLQPLSLESPHLGKVHPQQPVLHGLEFVRGMKGKGGKEWDTTPRCLDRHMPL